MGVKLSVVMAVGRDSDFVTDAVKSILGQSFTDFEFIIVADGVNLNRLKQWDKRIKLVSNRQRLGLTKSLNLALRLAQAPVIARMDADDIALPERLHKQYEYLQQHSRLALLGTTVNLIDQRGQLLRVKQLPLTSQEIKKTILHYCPFVHPTWMLRKSLIDHVGGYKEEFYFAQDYDLALRLAAKYPVANLAEPLLNYRVNNHRAVSINNLKAQERAALMARWLALTRYGYSWLEVWKLLKPALSFLVPASIKKIVYKKFYW